MKRLKRLAAVVVLAAVGTGGFMLGNGLLQDVQFARAEAQVQTSRAQLNNAQDLSTVFRNVGKVVSPSVVQIQVHKTIKNVNRSLPFDDNLLRHFFPDQNGDGQPDLPPGFGGNGDDNNGGMFEEIGTGSGVIIETDGSTAYIITNNHVAGHADEMSVTFADGRVLKNAKLVGADPKSDLAVIKLQVDHVIPAKWGDSSQLQKGDWIMAFGSPFGYIGSMTHGIVSALHRDVGIIDNAQGYENFIQVDAPINPGNSGGPLVNVHGEVVGINTAIASRSGGFQGIGFAIPSNQAKEVYQQLKTHGKVTRGWLGVAIASVDDPRMTKLVESFGYTKTTGVFVQQVVDGTPATGKLHDGDIITAMNGKEVKDVHQLRNEIADTAPGTEITLTIFRDKKSQDVKIKLGDQPENMELAAGQHGNNANSGQAEGGVNSAGLALSDLNEQIRDHFGIDASVKGAVVRQVAPNSPAAEQGIQPGDVITKVGNTAVDNAQSARDALSKADLSKGVRVYIVGKDASRFVFLQKTNDKNEE